MVIAQGTFDVPDIVHWGAALRDADVAGMVASARPAILNSSVDVPRSFPVIASRAFGWSGTPALDARTEDGARIESLHLTAVESEGAAATLRFSTASTAEVEVAYRLDEAGVLHASSSVLNTSLDRVIDVTAVRVLLPIPARAAEIVDHTGRWTREFQPQRASIRDGSWVRTSRRGRPGHDTSLITIVGTPGFAYRTGEVWASHIAWSGNSETIVERLPEGAGAHSSVLGAGELLDAGEVKLQPGEEYRSPGVVLAWSDSGIDGVTERFHRSVRARTVHPTRPRPLLLNTWEAVYFDHDFDTLAELADAAADVGVERFVLDDGWFRGRRGDTAGLGDWFVDAGPWPEGLRPLSDRVHGRGMQFGLWVEPEMVNLDSDLARAHPDWVLREAGELKWRHQFALDFSRDDVVEHILERLDRVIIEAAVDFVKWDHNRDLHAAMGADGARRMHAQTLGLYRMLAELRRRHPQLEIETCASGGGRADLGILEHTDRVWASDCNDPTERQRIQRGLSTLLPPELVGTHIGPEESHTTHRQADFSFRAATALFGHAGIEWDLSACSNEEFDAVSAWARMYRELRGVLHSGVTVRADHVDDGTLLHGIVTDDRREAVYAWVRLDTSSAAHTPRVPMPGLDPEQSYRVRAREEVGPVSRHQIGDPSWLAAEAGFVCSGAVLEQGLPLPLLNPGQALVLHVTAVE
ncbi:MAG: alpha-galactosidase [Microbacterium gubbeenense]